MLHTSLKCLNQNYGKFNHIKLQSELQQDYEQGKHDTLRLIVYKHKPYYKVYSRGNERSCTIDIVILFMYTPSSLLVYLICSSYGASQLPTSKPLPEQKWIESISIPFVHIVKQRTWYSVTWIITEIIISKISGYLTTWLNYVQEDYVKHLGLD